MTLSIQDIDITKLSEIDYVLQEDICRFIFETRYKQKLISYDYDGLDPVHFLYDKERCYQRFRQHIKPFGIKKPELLASLMDMILNKGLNAKIFYEKYCVVCYENKASILTEQCSHHVMCIICLKKVIDEGKRKCPICRTLIKTFYHCDI